MSEVFDLERLDRIRDRIGVIGDDAKLEGPFIRGFWGFLYEDKIHWHHCAVSSKLELAEQNREAKLQFAKHLYREGAA